jgi:signal transduction histidine kinase
MPPDSEGRCVSALPARVGGGAAVIPPGPDRSGHWVDVAHKPADLIAAWYRLRAFGIGVVAAGLVALAAVSGHVPFWAAFAAALLMLADSLWSRRRKRGRVLLSVWLGTTGVAVGVAFLQVPAGVLAVPFLFIVVNAMTVLPRRQALGMWCYTALLFGLVLLSQPLLRRLVPPPAGHIAAAQNILLVAFFTVMAVAGIVILEGVARRHYNSRQALLADLLQSKDEFLAGVSHALRTPLTCVVGFGQLLEKDWGHVLPAEAGEMLAELNQEAEELTGLVNDLVVRARDSTGLLSLMSEPTDLHELAGSVIKSFAWLYPDKVIRLRGDGRVMAAADPIGARQIIRNLMSNAIRHGGDLIVVEARAGAPATLTVSDDGPGLPEGVDLPDLAPFDKCNPSLAAPAMGLGLPVSLRLANLMGGSLHYRRDSRITSMTLTLRPAAPTDGRAGGLRHSTAPAVDTPVLVSAGRETTIEWEARSVARGTASV